MTSQTASVVSTNTPQVSTSLYGACCSVTEGNLGCACGFEVFLVGWSIKTNATCEHCIQSS